MSALSSTNLVSFLAPALILLCLLGQAARAFGLKPQGVKWCAALAGLAGGMVAIPLHGLPLARWLAGVVDHWSVPLLAWLSAVAVRQYFGVVLLRPQDHQAGLIFGLIAGLVLYPAALGLGAVDPYAWGWNASPLFAVAGVWAAALLWLGNRFGIVLVVAVIAWYLGVPESRNYWDCLVDPFYCLGCLGGVAWGFRSGKRGRQVRPAHFIAPAPE